MRSILIFGGFVLLAGCDSPEFEAAIEDPNGFQCRERGAGLMSVGFEQTAAQPINTDLFGTSNYAVEAGGVTFRCTVSSEGNIISFSRA